MFHESVLGPAESGNFICNKAKYVKIQEDGLEKLCSEMLLSLEDTGLRIPDTGADSIHPDKNHPKAADWVFVIDALNFCFWSLNRDDQWKVNGFTGYYALEAALYRAIEEGIDIINPEYFSKITEEELHKIFRGDTNAQIPLVHERVSVLHEVGTILLEKYNGTFENCIKEANKSAVKLLGIVVNSFSCFRDEAVYMGQKVSFYKRAQILVADLWNFFDGKTWGELYDIDKLTMFADYRVPQVLVHFGVLTYSEDLMEKLNKDALLESASEEEIEIRGCSIHAVELLRKKLAESIKAQEKKIDVPNSILIDYFLWCYRRKNSKEMEKVPYHKTLEPKKAAALKILQDHGINGVDCSIER